MARSALARTLIDTYNVAEGIINPVIAPRYPFVENAYENPKLKISFNIQ